MECGLPLDLHLVWGKLGWPNFVQVLDYSVFKRVDHCVDSFMWEILTLISKFIIFHGIHVVSRKLHLPL